MSWRYGSANAHELMGSGLKNDREEGSLTCLEAVSVPAVQLPDAYVVSHSQYPTAPARVVNDAPRVRRRSSSSSSGGGGDIVGESEKSAKAAAAPGSWDCLKGCARFQPRTRESKVQSSLRTCAASTTALLAEPDSRDWSTSENPRGRAVRKSTLHHLCGDFRLRYTRRSSR